MRVLQLSVHFPPNVGGVETHLWDLVTLLCKKEWDVFVLCYRPLAVKVSWKIFEKGKHFQIFRIPWIAGLFYKLIPFPKLEFLYLFPGLFITAPFIIFFKSPDVIHAHGLVAGFVATFWGKIFNIKTIISTHSLYSFPKKGVYQKFARFIFNGARNILCLSQKSVQEIIDLGISKEKVIKFTYWIDLKKFKIQNSKLKIKKKLGWDGKFIVLFVGRLIAEKGIGTLLQSVSAWNKNIGLVIIGTGPMEGEILKETDKIKQLQFLGKIGQQDLPRYYAAADCLIVPSTTEEGFGRVIIEALACGTPVIASKRGAIPEAMDETVGKLIDITGENIKNTVEDLYKNQKELKKLSDEARNFAQRRYSEKNADTIIKTYTN